MPWFWFDASLAEPGAAIAVPAFCLGVPADHLG